jgi:hypothetical protein
LLEASVGRDRSTVVPERLTIESDGRVAVTVHQVVRDEQDRTIADTMIEHAFSFVGDLVSDMQIRK